MAYEYLFDIKERESAKVDIAASTGVVGLDVCLGGGLPTGLTEIYGEESTGKTALAAHIIQSGQANGLEVMLCVSEKYDRDYLGQIGVSEDGMAVVRGLIEPVAEIAASFLNSSRKRLVVIDSLTALRSKEESIDTWNRNAFELVKALKDSLRVGSLAVAVNQVRSVWIGGKPTSKLESAAKWINDMFDTRLELHRKDVHEDRYMMVVNVVKSALSPPGVWVEVPMQKGRGVDLWRDLIYTACRSGVLTKNGGHYYMRGHHLANGEDEMVSQLMAPGDLFRSVIQSIYGGDRGL